MKSMKIYPLWGRKCKNLVKKSLLSPEFFIFMPVCTLFKRFLAILTRNFRFLGQIFEPFSSLFCQKALKIAVKRPPSKEDQKE